MPEANDWNDKIITEFRENGGRVGGPFEGAPVVLVHHHGRTSGRDYVNPMMYMPDDTDTDTIYVFATKGGAPTNPDWYYNVTAAGGGTVERDTETLPGDRPRGPGRRARPHLRRAGAPILGIRRLRDADRRHPNHPGGGVEARLRTHAERVVARGPHACSRRPVADENATQPAPLACCCVDDRLAG